MQIIILLFLSIISSFPGIASNDARLPHIIDNLAIKTRIEYSNGDKIQLRCPIVGDSPFKITWSKNGAFLEDSLARHYSVTGRDGQYLRLKRMNDEDVGEYECKGTNGFGSAVYIFSVRKRGEPKGVQLLSTKMIQEETVFRGDPTELKCLLRDLGDNDVVRWLKRLDEDPPESSPLLRDVIRIPSQANSRKRSFKRLDPDTRLHFNNSSYLSVEGHRVHSFSLVIQKTKLKDSGEYVCLVVEPLVDKKFKFNIGNLVVKDKTAGKSDAINLLAWNKVTLWAIFIPLSYILIEMGNIVDSRSVATSKSIFTHSPQKSDMVQNDSSSHIYQDLSLQVGPIGLSRLELANAL